VSLLDCLKAIVAEGDRGAHPRRRRWRPRELPDRKRLSQRPRAIVASASAARRRKRPRPLRRA
jgi:hypothetical protein